MEEDDQESPPRRLSVLPKRICSKERLTFLGDNFSPSTSPNLNNEDSDTVRADADHDERSNGGSQSYTQSDANSDRYTLFKRNRNRSLQPPNSDITVENQIVRGTPSEAPTQHTSATLDPTQPLPVKLMNVKTEPVSPPSPRIKQKSTSLFDEGNMSGVDNPDEVNNEEASNRFDDTLSKRSTAIRSKPQIKSTREDGSANHSNRLSMYSPNESPEAKRARMEELGRKIQAINSHEPSSQDPDYASINEYNLYQREQERRKDEEVEQETRMKKNKSSVHVQQKDANYRQHRSRKEPANDISRALDQSPDNKTRKPHRSYHDLSPPFPNARPINHEKKEKKKRRVVISSSEEEEQEEEEEEEEDAFYDRPKSKKSKSLLRPSPPQHKFQRTNVMGMENSQFLERYTSDSAATVQSEEEEDNEQRSNNSDEYIVEKMSKRTRKRMPRTKPYTRNPFVMDEAVEVYNQHEEEMDDEDVYTEENEEGWYNVNRKKPKRSQEKRKNRLMLGNDEYEDEDEVENEEEDRGFKKLTKVDNRRTKKQRRDNSYNDLEEDDDGYERPRYNGYRNNDDDDEEDIDGDDEDESENSDEDDSGNGDEEDSEDVEDQMPKSSSDSDFVDHKKKQKIHNEREFKKAIRSSVHGPIDDASQDVDGVSSQTLVNQRESTNARRMHIAKRMSQKVSVKKNTSTTQRDRRDLEADQCKAVQSELATYRDHSMHTITVNIQHIGLSSCTHSPVDDLVEALQTEIAKSTKPLSSIVLHGYGIVSTDGDQRYNVLTDVNVFQAIKNCYNEWAMTHRSQRDQSANPFARVRIKVPLSSSVNPRSISIIHAAVAQSDKILQMETNTIFLRASLLRFTAHTCHFLTQDIKSLKKSLKAIDFNVSQEVMFLTCLPRDVFMKLFNFVKSRKKEIDNRPFVRALLAAWPVHREETMKYVNKVIHNDDYTEKQAIKDLLLIPKSLVLRFTGLESSPFSMDVAEAVAESVNNTHMLAHIPGIFGDKQKFCPKRRLQIRNSKKEVLKAIDHLQLPIVPFLTPSFEAGSPTNFYPHADPNFPTCTLYIMDYRTFSKSIQDYKKILKRSHPTLLLITVSQQDDILTLDDNLYLSVKVNCAKFINRDNGSTEDTVSCILFAAEGRQSLSARWISERLERLESTTTISPTTLRLLSYFASSNGGVTRAYAKNVVFFEGNTTPPAAVVAALCLRQIYISKSVTQDTKDKISLMQSECAKNFPIEKRKAKEQPILTNTPPRPRLAIESGSHSDIDGSNSQDYSTRRMSSRKKNRSPVRHSRRDRSNDNERRRRRSRERRYSDSDDADYRAQRSSSSRHSKDNRMSSNGRHYDRDSSQEAFLSSRRSNDHRVSSSRRHRHRDSSQEGFSSPEHIRSPVRSSNARDSSNKKRIISRKSTPNWDNHYNYDSNEERRYRAHSPIKEKRYRAYSPNERSSQEENSSQLTETPRIRRTHGEQFPASRKRLFFHEEDEDALGSPYERHQQRMISPIEKPRHAKSLTLPSPRPPTKIRRTTTDRRHTSSDRKQSDAYQSTRNSRPTSHRKM